METKQAIHRPHNTMDLNENNVMSVYILFIRRKKSLWANQPVQHRPNCIMGTLFYSLRDEAPFIT